MRRPSAGGRRPGAAPVLVALSLLLAAGCAGLAGERWEVRAQEGLGRGALRVQVRSEGSVLTVALTLAPPSGEEAYLEDLFLSRVGGPPGQFQEDSRLRPEEVEPEGQRGALGVGFLYSTGDVGRYLRRSGAEGYPGSAAPAGPQRVRARWPLRGAWAQAEELELVVVVRLGVSPRSEGRTEEARFLLIRPRAAFEARSADRREPPPLP